MLLIPPLKDSESELAKVENIEIQNMNWLEKFNAIAALGTKLDGIQKSLSMAEVDLISHGLGLHNKALDDHAIPSTSLDFHHVQHLTKEDLVVYFNNVICTIKREHESIQHLQTDDYFRLKREYLKMKRSYFTRIKDDEFVALRKNFSAVISKLDDFLSENERFPALSTNLESMENMMHRLENLLAENRCLRDCLIDKENEVKCLKEQEILKQEILELGIAMENEQKLGMDLSKEREQFELASQELITSKEHASQLQDLVTESNKAMELLRSQHLEALEQIDVYEMEINKLKQDLGQTEAMLTEANRERSKTSLLVQEMHDKLSLSEAREQKMKKEMELAAGRFSKLFADFEWRVSGAIKTSTSRLEDQRRNIDLRMATHGLPRSELRQKLERANIHIRLAEAEVDLLGDEVDALLKLLRDIYIVLDHYSLILKHYPGIIEMVELVRRELTGESTIRS